VCLNRWYAALIGTSANSILLAAGPLFLMTKHGQALILCACHAYMKHLFSDEYCDHIIEAGEGLSHDPIGTGGTGDGRVNLESQNSQC